MKSMFVAFSIVMGLAISTGAYSYEVNGNTAEAPSISKLQYSNLLLVANRKGSKRRGGSNSHGKGSHYAGGRRRT